MSFFSRTAFAFDLPSCHPPAVQALRDEVTAFLKHHGLRLNTDLGQHFLVDDMALQLIVETAGIGPEDLVVEIGPGIGILTKELAARAGKVSAVELDERFIPLLKDYLAAQDRTLLEKVVIQRGNALFATMPEKPYTIVANIPYHITSPLLRHIFLESPLPPRSMTLLIQKEVAETICDPENAGMLTILVGLFGTPSYVATIDRAAFLPPPKVDSAILHVACFDKPRTDRDTMDRIFTLTKASFGQKRKMLRNTLGKLPEGMEKLKRLNIDPERRPQTLSIDEWIAVARAF
jgi:16S rRNA (adenine1518-N6/adenine1519-N6)-dimethyltransferase